MKRQEITIAEWINKKPLPDIPEWVNQKRPHVRAEPEWINSRHNVQQDDNEISDAVRDEIISLQSDADNAMMACLFLGGMLLMLAMVAYIAIVNHLI